MIPRIDPRLRSHYLHRLARLVRLRREYSDGSMNAVGLRLLDRAIEATPCSMASCRAAGEVEAVMRLLGGRR